MLNGIRVALLSSSTMISHCVISTIHLSHQEFSNRLTGTSKVDSDDGKGAFLSVQNSCLSSLCQKGTLQLNDKTQRYIDSIKALFGSDLYQSKLLKEVNI